MMQRKKRGKPGRKPDVRAECLARLKGGASPTELFGEFKPGPVYDALREYTRAKCKLFAVST